MVKRYTDEEKATILARVNEIGVKKTCEEFGVNAQSIYKWKRASDPRQSSTAVPMSSEIPNIDMEELKSLVSPDTELELRVKALEEENAMLRERNERMRKILTALANVLYAQ